MRVNPAARRWIATGALFAALCIACGPTDLRADPTDDYNVALEFYKQERWDVAARSFREFLTRNADHERAPSARLYLGQALILQRKFEEARKVYRDFLVVNADLPEAALARFRIAESTYFLQENEVALRELDDFLTRHANHELAIRALHYKGQTQLRLNDARGAAATLADVAEKSTDQALTEEARYGLARAREALGDPAGAEQLYQELAANTEGEHAPDAQFRLAALHFEAQDFARAAEEFAAVAQRFPEHRLVPSAELNAGYAEYSLNRVPQAIEHFQRAAADPAQAPTAELWIGLSHKLGGDFAAAARSLQAAYERDPSQPAADRLLFHWADSELRGQNFKRAGELFATFGDRFPDNERSDDSLHLATEAALRGGDLDGADRLNQQFEQQYPGSGLRWLQQVVAGRIDLARGDALLATDPAAATAGDLYRQAAAQFARVVAESDVAGTQLMARVQLARAHDRLREPQQVVEALQPLVDQFQSSGVNPELAEALLLHADTMLSLGRPDETVRSAELYLAQPAPAESAHAWGTVARAETHRGNAAAADAALTRLAEIDPAGSTSAQVAYDCAEIAYEARQWDRSASLFERVAELDPALGFHAAALSGLGYSRYELGQFTEAAETFAALLAAHAEDRVLASDAAHMRGLALQQSGNKEAAATAFQEGLSRFKLPDGTDPAEADLAVAYNAYRCAKGAARTLRELDRIDDADAAYDAAYRELKQQPAPRQSELDKLINEWALLSYEHERYARSDELFTLLIQERPDSDLADDARLYLAESRFFAQDLDAARTGFTALADDEKTDDFVRHRASLLLLDIASQQKDWPGLQQYAAEFLGRFPESEQRSYARYRAGEAALEKGDPDRAVEELSVLTADTDDTALSEAEWFPSVWVLLAEAHFRKKDYPQVEATVNAFRGRFPESPYLYHADEVLGRSYKNRALFEEARTAFRAVIESETGRRTETAARAQFHIAETYLIEKNFAAALPEYYKVYVNYEYPEWQAPALSQAAACDEELENWEGAVKSYEALLEEFPESEFAERARPRLDVARRKLRP